MDALSGCLTTILVAHASARKIELKSVESRYEGDMDIRGFLGISEDVQVGYQRIRVYFKVNADISEKQKQELIRLAQNHSPVFNPVAKKNPGFCSAGKRKARMSNGFLARSQDDFFSRGGKPFIRIHERIRPSRIPCKQ